MKLPRPRYGSCATGRKKTVCICKYCSQHKFCSIQNKDHAQQSWFPGLTTERIRHPRKISPNICVRQISDKTQQITMQYGVRKVIEKDWTQCDLCSAVRWCLLPIRPWCLDGWHVLSRTVNVQTRKMKCLICFKLYLIRLNPTYWLGHGFRSPPDYTWLFAQLKDRYRLHDGESFFTHYQSHTRPRNRIHSLGAIWNLSKWTGLPDYGRQRARF
jgi:hypothetical protein